MTPARWALAGAAACLSLTACGDGDDADTSVVAELDSGVDTTAGSPSTTAAPGTASASADDAPTTTDDVAATSPSATVAGNTDPATTVTGSTATTAPLGGARWTSPDKVFALAFPVEPDVQQFDSPRPDGTEVPVTAYLAEVDDAAVIASCVVAPGGISADTAAVLDDARDGALENVGATLVDSEPIELQGRSGLEFSGTIGSTGSVLARNYVDGEQVCQVLVIGEPDIVDVVAPPFLDSFEFLQEAA